MEEKMIENNEHLCFYCDEEARSISREVYETPWDEEPVTKTFCSDECMDYYLHGGDFSYYWCDFCDREICGQNPTNGWHIQFRVHSDSMMCLSCYQEEILKNGCSRDSFEDGSLPGMFFNVGNHAVLDAGFKEVGCYSVTSHSCSTKLCRRAIQYIDNGYKVLIAWERIAIGGSEGTITMFIKKK